MWGEIPQPKGRSHVEPTSTNDTDVDQAFELLRRLFCEEPNDKRDDYLPLLRSLRRLGGLCSELRSGADDALEFATASYESILSSVLRSSSPASAEELQQLAGPAKPASSVLELRVMTAQLHGWLYGVVSKLETAQEAEIALGMPLQKMLENASLVASALPGTNEAEAEHTYTPTGLYL